MRRAGQYLLEYTLSPAVPGHGPLLATLPIQVVAGVPARAELSGEACAVVATRDVLLGERMAARLVSYSYFFVCLVQDSTSATFRYRFMFVSPLEYPAVLRHTLPPYALLPSFH
jgi:hypothetical protein